MIQPFRETTSEKADNYNTIYEFIIKGTQKKPYTILIEVDEFNSDGKLVTWSCECTDFQIRKEFPDSCKHIKLALENLKQWRNLDTKDVLTG